MIKKPPSILVVDDNAVNRDLVKRRLRKHEVLIKEAGSGMEALDLLEEEPFDLVLLDVMMPGMSGYEVLEKIKNSPEWKDTPVLMISALTEVESVVRCIELGAEDYLPKPFNPTLLIARVFACLEKKRLRDKEKRLLEEIKREKQHSEDLLRVILPEPIIQELKEKGFVEPRLYENVAVIFIDVVCFTEQCENLSPKEVVENLQELVVLLEEICVKHGLEKIKTIGDAFMATSGLLVEKRDAVTSAVEAAMEALERAKELSSNWSLRIGIHNGAVMGGIVGKKQYFFDIWGDTVNTAARLEAVAKEGGVVLSEEAFSLIENQELFEAEKRMVHLKVKGDKNVFDLKMKPSLTSLQKGF